MNNNSEEIKLKKYDLCCYGILALPLAFAGIPLYINAPDFYVTSYGVTLSSLSFILLFLRFIDAVQDPIIGIVSDRYAYYRKYIIIISAICFVISFGLLFYPLTDSYILWFTIFVFLASTAFSIITVNFYSLGGIWRQDKHQKTIIISYREAFGLLGLLIAVTLPAILQNNFEKITAFLIVSIFLAVIFSIILLIFCKWLNRHNYLNLYHRNLQNVNSQNGDLSNENLLADKQTGSELSVSVVKSAFNMAIESFRSINKHTKKFLFIYFISMLASSIPAVLVIFFIRDLLNLESFTGLFLLSYFVAAALGLPIWRYISGKYGKYNCWMVSMALAIFSFVWAYFLNEGDFLEYLIICILSGIAFGAELVIPSSILADHISDDKNEQYASTNFGVLALLSKLALAFATLTAFQYLEYNNFAANAENSTEALASLSIAYALIPCVIKLFALYLVYIYNKFTVLESK
ncbi:MAG: MFS transporter [Pseudomonadota bacterium]